MAMTNQIAPDQVPPTPEGPAWRHAQVAVTMPPVKIVQHPAFRGHQPSSDPLYAFRASYLKMPVRVVHLNEAARPSTAGRCHA
jgi:hypothetical protein